MADLAQILTRLIEHKFEFVIVGGYAALGHGSTYMTFDVDVCAPCEMSDLPNLARLHAALVDLHPMHRMVPYDRPFVFPPRTVEETGNIYLKTDLGQIDVLGKIELGDFTFVLDHSVVLTLPFGTCRVLDCPTLIRSKKTTARPKDLLVAEQLAAILEAQQPPPP
ncbi:MAG: hypothetical protein DVB27_01985 [Verrucomicrobia bacterium]|nr:MAG: hypothetical protein DVB27_01985 [Verrucomicrobiota bacterium]